MKKLVIPAILTATILVAGMFALMPVGKASTVHTTIVSQLSTALFGTATIPTAQTAVLSGGGAPDFNLNCAMELDDTAAAGAFGTIACSAVKASGGIVDFATLTVTSAVLTEDVAGAITLGAAAEIGTTDRFTIAPSTDAVGGTVALDDLIVVVRATAATSTAEAIVSGRV